jgi:hypothetical protein
LVDIVRRLVNVRDEYAGMAGRLHEGPDGVAGLLLGPVDHLAQSPIKLLPIISWQGCLQTIEQGWRRTWATASPG